MNINYKDYKPVRKVPCEHCLLGMKYPNELMCSRCFIKNSYHAKKRK